MNRTIAITLACGLAAAFSTTASAQYLDSPCSSGRCPLQNDASTQSNAYGTGSRYSAHDRLSDYANGFCSDGSCSSAGLASRDGHTSPCGPNGCAQPGLTFGARDRMRSNPNATYGRQRGYETNQYPNTFNSQQNRPAAGHYPGDGHNHGGHYPGDGHNHAGGHYPGDGHNHATPRPNTWDRPAASQTQQNFQAAPLSQGPPPIGTLSQPMNTNRPTDNGNFF